MADEITNVDKIGFTIDFHSGGAQEVKDDIVSIEAEAQRAGGIFKDSAGNFDFMPAHKSLEAAKASLGSMAGVIQNMSADKVNKELAATEQEAEAIAQQMVKALEVYNEIAGQNRKFGLNGAGELLAADDAGLQALAQQAQEAEDKLTVLQARMEELKQTSQTSATSLKTNTAEMQNAKNAGDALAFGVSQIGRQMGGGASVAAQFAQQIRFAAKEIKAANSASMAMSGYIGIAIAAISAVITVINQVTAAKEKAAQAEREHREEILKTTEAALEEADAMQEIIQAENAIAVLKDQNASLEAVADARQTIISLFPDAIAGYNSEGQAILANNETLEQQIELLKEKNRLYRLQAVLNIGTLKEEAEKYEKYKRAVDQINMNQAGFEQQVKDYQLILRYNTVNDEVYEKQDIDDLIKKYGGAGLDTDFARYMDFLLSDLGLDAYKTDPYNADAYNVDALTVMNKVIKKYEGLIDVGEQFNSALQIQIENQTKDYEQMDSAHKAVIASIIKEGLELDNTAKGVQKIKEEIDAIVSDPKKFDAMAEEFAAQAAKTVESAQTAANAMSDIYSALTSAIKAQNQAAYNSRMEQIKKEYNAKIKAIDDELNYLTRAQNEADAQKRINELKEKLSYEQDETNRFNYRQELDKLLSEQAIEAQKEELQAKKTALKEEQSAAENAAKAAYNKSISYKNLEKQARLALEEKTQQELLALIDRYAPEALAKYTSLYEQVGAEGKKQIAAIYEAFTEQKRRMTLDNLISAAITRTQANISSYQQRIDDTNSRYGVQMPTTQLNQMITRLDRLIALQSNPDVYVTINGKRKKLSEINTETEWDAFYATLG
ncbi:MAG: hypothetical protein KH354_03525 [Clostridiales bacterium]|nr:hypothetical protein [Clostridiales bacterium]